MLEDICHRVYENIKGEDGTVNKVELLDHLEKRGILRDDPRISDCQAELEKYPSAFEEEAFNICIGKNISVTEKAFTNSFVISDFEVFSNDIKEIYNRCKDNTEGKLADYIPQLTKQNPNHFGVSVCTIDGQRTQFGDAGVEFSLQSCAKPINYCLAVEEHGPEEVHRHVGREPSGSVFNALKLNKEGLPHNPLINSGAIMICSLIKSGCQPDIRFDYVNCMWEHLSGGKPLGFSNSVYLSERMSGERNFALAYFMKEKKAFPPKTDIIETLEFYFQCCSMTITTNKLSIVAATLANGGVCPLTGEKIFSPETVKNCLSIMYSSGMYDYSGEFAFKIGLPAKSGVSGAIMLVIPNVMGICTFSPLLNSYGNSTRGVEFFDRLTEKFNFHLFDNIKMTSSVKENPRKLKGLDEYTGGCIIECCALGDTGALRRMHIKSDDLLKVNFDKRTALHLAASNGHLETVRFLLESDVLYNINVVDRWMGTPYDDAIREGHHEIAELLYSMGGKSGKEAVNVLENGHVC